MKTLQNKVLGQICLWKHLADQGDINTSREVQPPLCGECNGYQIRAKEIGCRYYIPMEQEYREVKA